MPTDQPRNGIHPGLQDLAYPVALLSTLPGNPRKGDVDAVARSYATFGQRKPIVARREGEGGIVLAGNHQLMAARALGWTEIAVVWVEDDDLTAKAFALADNHTAELGGYDERALADMIAAILEDDRLMAATSYTAEDLDKLLKLPEPGNASTDEELPVTWGVIAICKTEEEQVELLQRLMDEGWKCQSLMS